MFLTVIKPSSEITSLDLDTIPVWALRIEAVSNGDDGKGSLVLGIRYLAPGTASGTALVQILALNCRCPVADLQPVVRLGFPPDKEQAKDRLRESMKVLYNSNMPAKDVDELLPKAGAVVTAYFQIRDALFGKQPALDRIGPVAQGEFDGYRWAITRARFEAWCFDKDDTAPPAPGQEPETIVIPGGVPGGSVPPPPTPPPAQGKKGTKGRGHGSAPVE
jgi:hypothetical protein